MRTHATRMLGLLAVCLAVVGCATRPSPEVTAANAFPPAALLPVSPGAPTAPYQIQAGDELHVRFAYQPEMDEQVPVRPDGRITLGTTGEIDVVGLTPNELELVIEKKSSARLRNPEVYVILTKVAERRVYIGGEVVKPSYVVLQPDMTPLQAVLQVGGFRRTAELESVLLLTPGPDGKFSAARMDMKQVVEDGVPERVRLHPGDVVYAPPSFIGEMNDVVDLYVRGLIPVLPRVGVGYSLSGNGN